MATDNDKLFRQNGPGWDALIDPIVKRANEIGATIGQIKEKYGCLRVYLDPCYVDCDELEEMIDKAEADSATTCEMCGKIGHTMVKAHWWKTLCKEHAIDLDYRSKAE